jgi:hypothetical protein
LRISNEGNISEDIHMVDEPNEELEEPNLNEYKDEDKLGGEDKLLKLLLF